MKILVTGANGFIGSHLLELLLDRGDEVTGLVRPAADLSPIAPLTERYGARLRLIIGDLRDAASHHIDPDVEVVFHLGAVLMSSLQSDSQETNVQGTRNLLEAIVRERPARL